MAEFLAKIVLGVEVGLSDLCETKLISRDLLKFHEIIS